MCISPIYRFVDSGPNFERVPTPCKRCWQCKSNRLNDYVGRSLCEMAYSDYTLALTLTYADSANISSKEITPKHFQQFVKSLRNNNHKVRYIVCGEYGKLRGRAHFHCILFGKGSPPNIPQKENVHIEHWPHGHVFADWSADENALRYVLKYLLHPDKGTAWFSLSKKPPIGSVFFEEKAKEAASLGVLPASFDYLPPSGNKRKSYYMTRVTRRNYLQAIVDNWRRPGPFDYSKADEWTKMSLDKMFYEKAVKDAERYQRDNVNLEQFIANEKERLDAGRMSEEKARRTNARNFLIDETGGLPVLSEKKGVQDGTSENRQIEPKRAKGGGYFRYKGTRRKREFVPFENSAHENSAAERTVGRAVLQEPECVSDERKLSRRTDGARKSTGGK